MMTNPLAYHSLIALAIVLGFIVLTRAARWLLSLIGRMVIAQTETELDDKILEVVIKNVRPVMVLIGLHVAFRELRRGFGADDTGLHQTVEYILQILYVAGVAVSVKISLGMAREFLNWYLDKAGDDGSSTLKVTLGPLTNKIVNVGVGMVAVIIVLDHFGINIGSLLVSLGVGSLAVALAAQDTLANMIAGFVLLVDRPFRVGDRIEIGAGQIGDVKQIGLRSTRVLNFDNNMIVLPNAELVKGRIVNFTHPHLPTRVLLKFDLAYGTNPDAVRKILLSLAAGSPAILTDPIPQVFVTVIAESSVQFTLSARCKNYTEQFAAETSIREEAYRAFLKEKIELPISRRAVTMTGPN